MVTKLGTRIYLDDILAGFDSHRPRSSGFLEFGVGFTVLLWLYVSLNVMCMQAQNFAHCQTHTNHLRMRLRRE